MGRCYFYFVLIAALCGRGPLPGSAQVFHTPRGPLIPQSVPLKPAPLALTAEILPAAVPPKDNLAPPDPAIRFCLPLARLRLTSSFGWRIHPVTHAADFHQGIDLAARSEPVYCILDGSVIATGFNPILGNYIRIDHGGIQSIYGHLILVGKGQPLGSGQVIGVTGDSGRTTGEHLHFSIKSGGSYIHPLRFLQGLFLHGYGQPP